MRRMISGRTRLHQLNARVRTGANDHRDVSIEVRDGTATVRHGTLVLERRSDVSEVVIVDAARQNIVFGDGTVWESQRTQPDCGCR